MQLFVSGLAHVFWTKCRVVHSQLRPKAAPDLSRLPGGPVAVALTGGGMHQAGAFAAQETRLRAVEMQGTAPAPRAEEIRLVPPEGLWNACQDDRLIDRLPFTYARSEVEVQSDLILPAIEPDPVRRLAIVTAPAPTPAPAFSKHPGLLHRIG